MDLRLQKIINVYIFLINSPVNLMSTGKFLSLLVSCSSEFHREIPCCMKIVQLLISLSLFSLSYIDTYIHSWKQLHDPVWQKWDRYQDTEIGGREDKADGLALLCRCCSAIFPTSEAAVFRTMFSQFTRQSGTEQHECSVLLRCAETAGYRWWLWSSLTSDMNSWHADFLKIDGDRPQSNRNSCEV